MKSRKSDTSRTNNVDATVVVTVAVRIVSFSKAISPKNEPGPSRIGCRLDSHFDFAGRDEIHAVARPPAADDGGSRRQIDAPQHARQRDDGGRIEIAQKRHARHQVPVLNKIRSPMLGGETVGENAGPQSEYAEAADHHVPAITRPRNVSGTASP